MRTPTLLLLPLSLAACLTGTLPATDGGATQDGMVVHPSFDGGGRDVVHPADVTVVPDGGAGDVTVTLDATAPIDAVPESGLPSRDASGAVDGAFGDGAAASRCTMSASQITCTAKSYTITTPAGTAGGSSFPSYARVVHYQVPLGAPPAAGWPSVIMFQGSFISAAYTFSASSAEQYGLYYQTELVKKLLDAGYAVLAPEALQGGSSYWQTNIAPYAANWPGCPDDLLVKALLADISAGTFGTLDATSLYATGISSGGYMTSRMAVSYVGEFKALAIESGSYATCLAGACTIPALPPTHPPTLLLHGTLDLIVPESTVTAYKTALMTAGIPENEIDDAQSGHQWIPQAPAAVLAWFQKYP